MQFEMIRRQSSGRCAVRGSAGCRRKSGDRPGPFFPL